MKTIGMIIPTTDNAFFSNLAHAAEQYLGEKGYILFVCDSGNDAEKEKTYLKTLAPLCEGILDVSGLSELGEDLLPENYPIVFVDRKPASKRPVPWVANDDEAAMKEATEYLIESGCRNIVLMPGFIAQTQDNPRIRGYKAALENNGIGYDEAYVLRRTGKGTSETETEELVMNIMREGKKVDAIVTSSDRAAFGVSKALGRTGYYVPEDVKLISFDNSPYTTMASPSVTAIDRNASQISKNACEVLLQVIAGEDAAETTIIPVSLVKRDSTR